MVSIIDLKLVSYGNTKKATDGSFSCQHGVDECKSDVLELCTQYKLSNDASSISTGDTSLGAWPFILCMEQAEGDPTKGESCYTSTMDTKALPWSAVTSCAKEEESLVQTLAMKATPSHDYVPWVLVGGSLLENTNLLQKAICDAYTGQPPASCKLLQPVEKSSTNSTVCLFSDN